MGLDAGSRKTTVLVVGAGPVGAVLAMDLASRNVAVQVVERRNAAEPWAARCNTIASRTMEILRRLKVADKMRAVGLPSDYPNDVVWTTRGNGREIARVHLASRDGRFTDMSARDANWPTPEPVHRASQLLFDQVLVGQARDEWNVDFSLETEFLGYVEDAEGVTATVRSLAGGEPYEIRCQYLVGCDGGRSVVRRQLGARLSGDDALYRSRSSLIRAPWMLDHLKTKPAWMTHYFGPGPFGGMIAIDGENLWLVHLHLDREQADFDALDVERGIRKMLDLPDGLTFETLHREDWVARRLIADRFRNGRIFICGDAAHLWPPFGGHGMNTGIADAANLSWLLAAVNDGWASTAILDCYQAERQPVTDQVSRFAMEKVIAFLGANQKKTAPVEYDWDNEAGRLFREAAAERLHRVNSPQYATAGLNFGYYYDNSPIIAYDGEAAPGYDMGTYVPSTAPGCRLPHFWTPDGRSLYDLLGPGYTLLRFDPAVDVEPLVDAARSRRTPLAVLDLALPTDLAAYRHKLVLSRPDQHVAWRGDAPPDSALELIDLIRGARLNDTLRSPTSVSHFHEKAGPAQVEEEEVA